MNRKSFSAVEIIAAFAAGVILAAFVFTGAW